MNTKVLNTLEFNKIMEQLADCATSAPGKKLCLELQPLTSIQQIEHLQQETSDAFRHMIKKDSFSCYGLMDMHSIEKHLSIASALNCSELLSVVRLLQLTETAKQFGQEGRSFESNDSLSSFFNALDSLSTLCKTINRSILSEEEIADEASSTLSSIRREINKTNDRIRSSLNKTLQHQKTREYLSDTIITTRDGRYCLPVRAEFKNKIPGMVHDQSSSGNTLFIEPMFAVEANNHLRELYLQEKEEIHKILVNLSQLVNESIGSIIQNYEILSQLDFIFARATLAYKQNAMRPIFNQEGRISLRQARHPLLPIATVVPIDVTLGSSYSTLIVTGPNTGGKTVLLKTVGLLSLMGQSGLFIPSADHSELSVFEHIYADIGDEQSIEQSLSTFSSHMKNIISILKEVDVSDHPESSLVLFDELCSGTDPLEGAALAMSILEGLRLKKVRTMATTHYSELKTYALSTDSVSNASCEFDIKTLSPTYHLIIGIPGKSNAFAISQKLGLPDSYIQNARNQLAENDKSFEELLTDLEEHRHELEQQNQALTLREASLIASEKDLQTKLIKFNEQKESILRNANDKASHILKDAKDTADAAIRNINKYGISHTDIAALEKQRANLGKKVAHTQKNASDIQKNSQPCQKIDPRKIHVGDAVKVRSLNLNGTIHSLPNARGFMEIQMGIMRSKINISDIELLSSDDITLNGHKHSQPSTKKGRASFSKAATISTEIKLLGYTTDEAISILDKYLDDAYLSHLSTVRVVHGKGTGALRNAVHQYLRSQKHVKSFHLAEYGEGDAGVTIVEFR